MPGSVFVCHTTTSSQSMRPEGVDTLVRRLCTTYMLTVKMISLYY